MLKQAKAFSGFSVDNLANAKEFYGNVLGLEVSEDAEMPMLNLKLSDQQSIMVYEKPDHEPATFTILNFLVADLAKTVADLKGQGVNFESYDLPDLKTDDDHISRGGGPLIAWFTDPAGNILSVIEEE